MLFYYVVFIPLVLIIPPSLLYIPSRHFHFESSCTWIFMWGLRRLPLEEAYYLKLSLFQGVEYFFWVFSMLYQYLVLNIRYQSSRSLGFAATSETPWNFHYNLFCTMFQKERRGGYLVDIPRYVGLKIQLPRPYTFGDTSYTR